MLIKLADLRWRQQRDRPPHLIGKVAGFLLLLAGRHNPAPGDPDFTLLSASGRRRRMPWPSVGSGRPSQATRAVSMTISPKRAPTLKAGDLNATPAGEPSAATCAPGVHK
jgi:hypothetical protein